MKKKAVQKIAKRALRERRLPRSQLQFGAICYRIHPTKGLQVLLITSRRTRRWISPKGWPMKGRKPWEVAEIEAFEEAGVQGEISRKPLGFYSYRKLLDLRKFEVTCLVQAYRLHVTEELDRFPEVSQRRRKWMKPDKARKRVRESELSALIRLLEDQVSVK
ncbi:MAG: NUDIX hydrolase [Pseudomonadota bacterium]